MSKMLEFVQEQVEQALLNTHTALLARAAHIEEGGSLTLEPLTLGSGPEGRPLPAPVLAGVPKLKGVEVQKGDICLCICCERDISRAVFGQLSLPGPRRHSLSDAVVVGVIEG